MAMTRLNFDKFCFLVHLNLCTRIKTNFLHFSDQNFSLVIVLSLFLIFGQISAWVFLIKFILIKFILIKKKRVVCKLNNVITEK